MNFKANISDNINDISYTVMNMYHCIDINILIIKDYKTM